MLYDRYDPMFQSRLSQVRKYLVEVITSELEPFPCYSLASKELVKSPFSYGIPGELYLFQYPTKWVHILELLETVLHIVGLAYLVYLTEGNDIDEPGLLHHIHYGGISLLFPLDSHIVIHSPPLL